MDRHNHKMYKMIKNLLTLQFEIRSKDKLEKPHSVKVRRNIADSIFIHLTLSRIRLSEEEALRTG